MLRKQDQIISKTFWVKKHKYGITVPNIVKEAIEIDKKNGNTLWWDAIMKEMKMYDMGEMQGRSTNRIPINQVLREIRHQAL